MKYCTKCGTPIADEAVICFGCGCSAVEAKKSSGLATAARVFMVLGTVIMGLYILPLAWCIPMTVSYFKKVKNNQPISTGFKVCSLLFVSLLGGVFMLCEKDT